MAWTHGLIVSLFLAGNAAAKTEQISGPLDYAFSPVPVVSPKNISDFLIGRQDRAAAISQFCKKLRKQYETIRWTDDPCGNVNWQVEYKSPNGHPLIYAAFGTGKQTTLYLGGVHPDEFNPIPVAFRFANYLHNNKQLYQDDNVRAIVAPLVNPDGFIRVGPTRTNANGIDLNRNFFTTDWYARSQVLWDQLRARNPTHFPGYFPNSEIETIFQVSLIENFRPDKILSIHAPLGFLDYDGPGDRKPRELSKGEDGAKKLVHTISEKAKNYRVVDYTFYPGSLGNFAGNERDIPTITLELPTTNPEKVEEYWQQFLPGMLHCFKYPYLIDGSRDGWKLNAPYTHASAKSK